MTAFAQLGKSAGWGDVGDIAAGVTSFIPVVGGAINGLWNGGRALYHAAGGNYGRAAESLAFAGLGFIPGAAAAARAAQAAGTAAKGVGTLGKIYRGVGSATNAIADSGKTLYRGGKLPFTGMSVGPVTTGRAALAGGALVAPSIVGSGAVPGLRNAPAAPAPQPQMYQQSPYGAQPSWGQLAANITNGV